MSFFRLLAACLLLCATPATAWAERYLLRFDGSAYGVLPLGQATLDIALDDAGYVSRASIRSGGLAVLFDHTVLSAQSDGQLDAQGQVVFGRYQLDHSYARKRRVIDMRPTDAGIEALITPPLGDPMEIRPTQEQKRGARDPLSSLTAMAAQVGATGDCAGRFPTFDGRFRYDLILRREGRDRHVGGGYDGPALKCKIRFVPIAGYRTRREMERRIPEGEVWFALLPGRRFAPPIRITAPLPLGHAGVRLARFIEAEATIEPASAR